MHQPGQANQFWLRPLSSWPLRVKLVAAVVMLVTVGLTVASGAAVTALRTYLYDKVDEDLLGAARQVAGGLQQSPNLTIQPDETMPPSQYVLGEARYGANSTDFYKSRFSPVAGLPEMPSLDAERAHSIAGEPFTVDSSEGASHWRVVVLPYRSGAGYLVVGVSLAQTEATVARLTVILVVVGGGVLVLVGALGYVIVRTSLRPLDEVEATTALIAAGDLSRRVPRHDPHTEVGRLSTAFNTMLGQIEQAFRDRQNSEAAARSSEQKMRQFVADASHELRTPLTSIRGFSELYRQGAVSSQGEVDRLLGRIEDEATRMGLLVDDLLLLARLDQERPMEHEPVDLVQLAQDAVGDGAAVQPERDISLEADRAVVVGDESRLRQVLGNLVRNALTHTPAEAPVVVRVGPDPGDPRYVRLDVTDHGPGLSPEDARQVFERFYRADPSRSRAAGGTGLGLSIVAAIVAGHGGWVTVETAPGAGATFRILLPRSEPPEDR